MNMIDVAGVAVAIPELCFKHDVPYKVLAAPMTDEERLMYMDRASISTTLRKKYGLRGIVHAWQSPSTGTNPIVGSIVHGEAANGEEVELGGYLLGSYAGLGVEISVMTSKAHPPEEWSSV